MHDFVPGSDSENGQNIGSALPHNSGEIGMAIVNEALCERVPVGISQAYQIPRRKMAGKMGHSCREQALSFADEPLPRPVVDRHRAFRDNPIRDPALARTQRNRARQELGTAPTSQSIGDDGRTATIGNPHHDSAARADLRRLNLRGHAAGPHG